MRSDEEQIGGPQFGLFTSWLYSDAEVLLNRVKRVKKYLLYRSHSFAGLDVLGASAQHWNTSDGHCVVL